MANTSFLYTRMDNSLKNTAADIRARIPTTIPVAVGNMSREQLDAELNKGIASIRNGAVFSADEADDIMKQEFDVSGKSNL